MSETRPLPISRDDVRKIVTEHTSGLFDDPNADRRLRAAAERISYHVMSRLAAAPAESDAGMVVVSREDVRQAIGEIADVIYPQSEEQAVIQGLIHRLRAALGEPA